MNIVFEWVATFTFMQVSEHSQDGSFGGMTLSKAKL